MTSYLIVPALKEIIETSNTLFLSACEYRINRILSDLNVEFVIVGKFNQAIIETGASPPGACAGCSPQQGKGSIRHSPLGGISHQ